MHPNLLLTFKRDRAVRPFLDSYLLEAVYFSAVYRRDAPSARNFLSECAPSSFENAIVRSRATAATLLAEGHRTEAAETAAAGIAAMTSNGADEREWLEAIVARGSGSVTS